MGDTILVDGLSHHWSLLIGYALALLVWDRIAHRKKSLWPASEPPVFRQPWLELALFGLALLMVLGIGQLYVRHWLLPARGAVAQVIEALNQIIIFSPVLALPLVRRQGLASAWLPRDHVWIRLAVGIVLSLAATLVFTSVRTGSAPWVEVLKDVYHPKNFGNLVQVLCEDIAMAILFVRMRAAVGLWKSIFAVAGLFAAAHIPAMLSGPVSAGDIAGLAADAGLAVVVLYFLQRSADILWFWWVHFAMDMMQFYAVTPPPPG